MEEQEKAGHDPVSEWVTFRLGDEKYGINVMMVREVLKNTELAPVPGAPYYVLGIINLRGNVVTVIDTRTRFGLPAHAFDDATRIVIVEREGLVVGMMVDSVAEVANLRESQIEFAPNVGNDESAKYIHGVSSQDDELLILIDLQRLLTTEDLLGSEAH
ncbi:MAG: chemotaxis protein CheW [Gammaproteobacteria bacterium]|nr:chemotaxis protein CheW [Gammaproteobacteria bacterium]